VVVVLAACKPQAPAKPSAQRLMLGSPDPYWAAQVSPDGSRILLCQARRDLDGNGRIASWRGLEGEVGGDRLMPYLVNADGTESELDPVVGSDAGLSRLLVVRQGALLYNDAVTRTVIDLRAPWRNPDPERGAMVASIDPKGRVLLFTRDGGLVAWDVAAGVERAIDAGPGLVLKASIHPDGDWVVLEKVIADTDGDGVLDGPANPDVPRDACGNQIVAASAAAAPAGAEKRREVGDEVRVFVLPIGALLGEKAEPREIPGFEQVAGELILQRKADGTFAWSEGEDLTPPGCKPEVEQILPRVHRIIFKCQNGKIGVSGQGFSKWLEAGRETFTTLDFTDRNARLVTLARGKKERQKLTLVDTTDGAAKSLARGERVLATAGSRVLLQGPCGRKREAGHGCLTMLDVITGDAKKLDLARVRPELVQCELTQRTSDVVVAAGVVLDLGTGRPLGLFLRCPVLVTQTGKLLYGAEHQVLGESGVPRGPLYWLAPLPCSNESCGFESP